MTAHDPTRLLCAWCGEPLISAEVMLHVSYRYSERWGWHTRCWCMDALTKRRSTWEHRRAIIEARGPGRVGKIGEVEP